MDEWLADGARSAPPYPAGRFASSWNNCPGNEVSLFIPTEMIDGIVGDYVPPLRLAWRELTSLSVLVITAPVVMKKPRAKKL